MDTKEFAVRHLMPISLIVISILVFFYLIYFHRIFILMIALYLLIVSIALTLIYTGKTIAMYLKLRKFHKRLRKEIEKFKE
ncbi:MAG: hypothetical protein H5T44_01415 [Thermoplasmatales archaeon]|nr:hypothetical protein [Thermoplasmatales archaeon]